MAQRDAEVPREEQSAAPGELNSPDTQKARNKIDDGDDVSALSGRDGAIGAFEDVGEDVVRVEHDGLEASELSEEADHHTNP